MHFAIPQPRSIDPRVEAAVERHGRSAESLLPILRSLNESCCGLSRAMIEDVAQALNLAVERVEGVATFYAMLSTEPDTRRAIRVCDGLTCWLNGAQESRKALERKLSHSDRWTVVRNSCLGLCDRAPAAFVEGKQCGPLAPETIDRPVEEWSGTNPAHAQPLEGELRVVLRRAGRIDPYSIHEAMAQRAYDGLRRALGRSPKAVLAEIEDAGLQGRGGAGFPTGRKWRMVADSIQTRRYVICNADESEPLTFKDRALLESDPHGVLEGMAVCGYAVGARDGIVYIRGEYEPQAELLEQAIEQAVEQNMLGDRIGGTDFSFHVSVHRGAGAYICGEESALLESLEGRRGEPRIRPPYPSTAGFRGYPTVVNNVETFAAAAAIVQRGSDEYRRIGNPDHPGTRLFTLQGHIGRTGLVEIPYGLTLRQIIDQFGGGIKQGGRFHFALTGGAAGSFVDETQLDIPLTPSAGTESSITLGSGGILVCDESVSPVAVLREAMWFFEQESCGKCTPCRIGTVEARRTLDSLLSGQGTASDLDRLRRLADSLRGTSFCALGKFAALPVATAMEKFPQQFRSLVSGR